MRCDESERSHWVDHAMEHLGQGTRQQPVGHPQGGEPHVLSSGGNRDNGLRTGGWPDLWQVETEAQEFPLSRGGGCFSFATVRTAARPADALLSNSTSAKPDSTAT